MQQAMYPCEIVAVIQRVDCDADLISFFILTVMKSQANEDCVCVLDLLIRSMYINQSINQSVMHNFISKAGGRWNRYLTFLCRK